MNVRSLTASLLAISAVLGLFIGACDEKPQVPDVKGAVNNAANQAQGAMDAAKAKVEGLAGEAQKQGGDAIVKSGDELLKTLSGVKDEATATQASGLIEKAGAALSSLGGLDAAAKLGIDAKVISGLREKLTTQIDRIKNDPKLKGILGPVLEKLKI